MSVDKMICMAFVYVIEAIIAWLYAAHLYEPRRRSAFVAALYAAGHLLLFVIYCLWNITVINTFSFFIVTALLTWFCFSCSPWAAALHSAILSFVMTAAEILVGLMLSTFMGNFATILENFASFVALCAASKLLYYLFVMAIAHLFRPQQDRERDPVMAVLLSALPLATLLVADTVIYVGKAAALEPLTAWLMAASVLALTLVDLLVLVIYMRIRRITRENARLALITQKDEADARMYRLLQERYGAQRVLIHDIRHHHRLLEDMLRQQQYGQAADYLHRLGSLPEQTDGPPSQ